MAIFERLSECFEGASAEFGHFVQKQDTMVSKGDFTRPRRVTTANESDMGGTVMRGSEGPHSGKGQLRIRMP